MPLTALLFGTLLVSTPKDITLDPGVKFQKWDGWGTSLAWWAYVVGDYPPKVREDVMQKFFGYLKMNVVRYNIGGGENPEHNHMEYRAQLPGYMSKDGKWDWNADASQRWVLQRAKELGANRFESFSNAPPYWMTISQCASGNHDGKDNLDPKKFGEFAEYLVEVNEHFRTHWGITFETLEPLNEPNSDWWKYGGRQEGCRISLGAPQSQLIETLDEVLKRRKSKTKIAASDESIIDTAVKSWDALSPEAKKIVSRINSHHYGGSQQLQLHERAKQAKKPVWMSEEGDNDPTGLTMAGRIVKDLREMQPSAWLYWQVIDQNNSKWGLLDMDLNHKSYEYVVHKKFYVMGNFSRFIRPGSHLIQIDDPQSIAAIKGPDLAIVSVNGGEQRYVTFDLSKFKKLSSTIEIYRTSETEDLARSKMNRIENRVGLMLPANSVTTLVLKFE